MKRTPIDLTHRSQPQGIALFMTKADAAKFAQECGWFARDTKLVRFRFQERWTVAQEFPGSLVFLTSDRSTIEVEWNATYVR